MEQGNITTRVDFRDLIDVKDSNKYIDFVGQLADKIIQTVDPDSRAQRLTIPFSSDQPEDIPLALAQAQGKLQVIVSRRTLVISCELPSDESVDYIVEKVRAQLGYIFGKNSLIEKGNVRSIISSIARTANLDSMEQARDFMNETEYRNFSDEINGLGFSFGHFTDSSIAGVSGQSITYSTTADYKTKQKGIQSVFTMIVGGLNFVNAEFNNITKSDIDEYIAGINGNDLHDLLGGQYGFAGTK
jgi:hypothetical protein